MEIPRVRISVAGILPYCIMDSQVYVLLGRENDSGSWCGFTGRRDRGEHPRACAVREGWEESAGILGTREWLYHLVHHPTTRFVMTLAPTKGRHEYYSLIYLLPVPYNPHISVTFEGVRQVLVHNKADHHFTEKDQVAWFSITELLEEIVPLRFSFKETIMTMIRGGFIQKLISDEDEQIQSDDSKGEEGVTTIHPLLHEGEFHYQ